MTVVRGSRVRGRIVTGSLLLLGKGYMHGIGRTMLYSQYIT